MELMRIRACKEIITRLLEKNEKRRLGSGTGASEVKQHRWFAKVNWGLLRNARPPIVPAASSGADAVNFRTLRESGSVDFERHGLEETGTGDLFGAFSSVTLKHDGES